MSKSDELIVNFDLICRLCLAEKRGLSPIFSKSDSEVPLHQRIMSCASVLLFDGDGLPAQICNKCLLAVNQSYELRGQVERADAQLRQILQQNNEQTEETNTTDGLQLEGKMGQTKLEKSNDSPEVVLLGQQDVQSAVTIVVVGEDESRKAEDYKRLLDKLAQNPSVKISRKSKCTRKETSSGSKIEKSEVEYAKETLSGNDKMGKKPLASELTVVRDNPFEDFAEVDWHQICDVQIKEESGVPISHEDSTKVIQNVRQACIKVQRIMNAVENTKSHFQGGQKTVSRKFLSGSSQNDPVVYIKGARSTRAIRSATAKPFDPFSVASAMRLAEKERVQKYIPISIPAEKIESMEKQGGSFETVAVKEKVKRDYSAIISVRKPRSPIKKRVPCPHCELILFNANLRAHIKYHHQKVKNYLCQECGYRSAVGNTMRKHIKAVHMGERQYVCDLCGLSFSHKCGLEDHILIKHLGKEKKKKKRKHLCHYCGKKFVSTSCLRDHTRTHTNETPFICQFCNRGFKKRWAWKTHERLHTGVKPYKCSFCGEAFTQNCVRKNHEYRVHGNEEFNPKNRKPQQGYRREKNVFKKGRAKQVNECEEPVFGHFYDQESIS